MLKLLRALTIANLAVVYAFMPGATSAQQPKSEAKQQTVNRFARKPSSAPASAMRIELSKTTARQADSKSVDPATSPTSVLDLRSPASPSNADAFVPAADDQTDTVRDRFPNGKIHIERSVVLDAQGNYVNHGEYRELNEKGDLITSGSFDQGLRVGVWVRVLMPSDARILQAYPFNKLTPPFQSTVEFHANEMNGTWLITDRDKKVASQVQLRDGTRHGMAVLFHPNGQIFTQAEFSNGVIEGHSIEKNAEGKVVRDDLYTGGQRQFTETEHHSNKNVKSVMQYLTAASQVTAADNWSTTTFATFTSPTNKQLHGSFLTYHENGQVASKGRYAHGKLEGQFESWYTTGEVAASGRYVQGAQDGPWVWRHANGMKRAVAKYVSGKLDGQTHAWDEQGKAVIH